MIPLIKVKGKKTLRKAHQDERSAWPIGLTQFPARFLASHNNQCNAPYLALSWHSVHCTALRYTDCLPACLPRQVGLGRNELVIEIQAFLWCIDSWPVQLRIFGAFAPIHRAL